MTYTLSILGNNGGMYPASLDLHATCPLYQCLSLEDMDRYFRVVYSVVWSSFFWGWL